MDNDQEVVREFLVESAENLARLDQDMVDLEAHPQNAELLARVFRTIHTIKGTCGFFGFSTLECITHQAENLLSQLRDGRRALSPSLVSLILETVDATRKVLRSIEETGQEGPEHFESLEERLRAACEDHPEEHALEGPVSALEAPAASVTEATGKPPAADGNIRVGVGLLDKLMDLVGELVLVRNQILQFTADRDDVLLSGTSQRLNLITTELQEGVMKTRMQPIGVIWNKLPRVVRDIAVSLGKQIRMEMDGAETELDRTIIEAIKDPLVHLVRNACDHGVETSETRRSAGKPAQGTLALRAYHEGGQVNIEISDDGAGIDAGRIKQKAIEKGLLNPELAPRLSEREALDLIFLPGFTTVSAVSNISGRGVGMDVVKTHIEKIGGTVEIASRLGEGTTVKLRIPLTLAIIPGLVVTSGGERFVIPQVSLLELIRLDADSTDRRLEHVYGKPVYRRRGKLLPIAFLSEVLGLAAAQRGGAMSIVVLQAEDRQYGLVVDGISDTQEIVVKPLGKQLKGLSLYAGATIMGDGRVALILDAQGIGHASELLGDAMEQVRADAETAQKVQEEQQQRYLLFRSGSHERIAIPLPLVGRLEKFPSSSIERSGETLVAQYRHRILPLVVLRTLLEGEAAHDACVEDTVSVIVFEDGKRQLGVAVDQILDIAEQTIAIRQESRQRWFLGSAVVGSQVTEFLDVEQLLRSPAAGWFQKSGASSARKKVLLGNDSAFARGLVRGSLEMSGYTVREAANLDEMLRSLEQSGADAVLVSQDLPPRGSAYLREAMHGRPEWEAIPVLEITPENKCAANRPGDGHPGNSTQTEILTFLSELSDTAAPEIAACAGGARTNS